MPLLLIRHLVEDFQVWKHVFLVEAETRRSNGSQAELLYRNSDDPGEVWIFLQWDDLNRARLFVRSDEMHDALARARVIGQPSYWYLEEDDADAP